MKKTIKLIGFSIVAGAVALTLSLASCEKENKSSDFNEKSDKTNTDKKSGNSSTEKSSYNVVIENQLNCIANKCGVADAIQINTRLNQISVTRLGMFGSNVRFAIYKYQSGPANGNQQWQLVDQFDCTSNVSTYASYLLLNNTNYLLTKTDMQSVTNAVPLQTITYNPSTGYWATDSSFPLSGDPKPFTTSGNRYPIGRGC